MLVRAQEWPEVGVARHAAQALEPGIVGREKVCSFERERVVVAQQTQLWN